MLDNQRNRCDRTTTGILPECGMLAVPYVPVQRSTEDSYQADTGLLRGTLFPGLDLPFRGMINSGELADTPMSELMALGFAVHELGLYLDTHQDDQEAMELFMKYNKLYGEGVAEYERRYGPLQMTATDQHFNWVDDPWPWDFQPTTKPEPRNRNQREG